MMALSCAKGCPLIDPMKLESLVALRSPDEDIRIMAIREFMLHAGLSSHPVPIEPPARAKPTPGPFSSSSPNPQHPKPPPMKRSCSRGVRRACQACIHEASSPELTTATPSSPEASVDRRFEICEIHAHLEVCETRIVNGTDKQHRHPALCVEAANILKKLKHDEEEMGRRYAVGLVVEKVPTFWPPRFWDSEETRLCGEASRLLEEKIEEQIPDFMRTKLTVAVFLNGKDYVTDGSDDETDWDDV
jgi:hypothetical protein